MMVRVAERMARLHVRVPAGEVDQLDNDLAELGLSSRSEALREGVRLLHRQAEQAALLRDYDEFYRGQEAPLGEVAAFGDHVAAATMVEITGTQGLHRGQ